MITQNDQTERADQIIDAAQKRFGLYGLEKTSMREIAEDLNVTKGSLYYYFPDKEHLYMAVIEREQKQFLDLIEAQVSSSGAPEEVLKKYVEARIHYFRSLLNLSRLRVDAYKGLKPVLKDLLKSFNEKEVSLIKKVMVRGIEESHFHIEDAEATTRLYLDLLRGLRQTVLSHKEMINKAFRFNDLFIRGLKYRE